MSALSAVSPVVVPVFSSESDFNNLVNYYSLESDEIPTIKKCLKFNMFNFLFDTFDIFKPNNEGDKKNYYNKLIELKPEMKNIIKLQIMERLEKIINDDIINGYHNKDKLIKKFNITALDDDIYINLDLMNIIDLEEEEEFIIKDSFKCFICLEDEGERETVLKYCKNTHSEKICLKCYRDYLFKNSNSSKCPLCRENINNKEEININEINEDNEKKRQNQNYLIDKLKEKIYFKIKRLNEDVKEQYFLIYESKDFLYPILLKDIISNESRERIEKLKDYKVIIKGKGKAKPKERNIKILDTDKILNFKIVNKEVYDNLYILLLDIIMKEYIDFENEDAEIIRQTVSIFYFLYQKIKPDYIKFFITAGAYSYRKNINLYLIYKYIIGELENDETADDELLIKIVDDFIINDDDEKYKFKYNNQTYNHTIKYSGIINIIISELNKETKKYEEFKYNELLIEKRTDLEKAEKENFEDEGFLYCNYYDYLENKMPYELWQRITENLSDFTQSEGELFYNEFIKDNIDLEGYISVLLDEKINDEYEELFIDEEDELNYILVDGIEKYLSGRSFDTINFTDF